MAGAADYAGRGGEILDILRARLIPTTQQHFVRQTVAALIDVTGDPDCQITVALTAEGLLAYRNTEGYGFSPFLLTLAADTPIRAAADRRDDRRHYHHRQRPEATAAVMLDIERKMGLSISSTSPARRQRYTRLE